jgi:8-demethyl-8-(2,3,4-trimethoxy-alpha-L-rhamnosyl)tetracenomycin-C O-methyltransferase
VRQVVIVAAGLDTRAFRLGWPDGTVVYEVDQALVLKFKDEVLGRQGAQARCERHTVPADLREDWVAELRAAGFDATRPTAWLTEGLLSFLSPEAEAGMFAAIRELSAPGSRLAVEAIGGAVRHMAFKTAVAEAWRTEVGLRVEEVWNPEPRPEPVDVLREHGWTVEIERVAEAGRSYGRPVLGVMNPPAEHAMLLDCAL